MRNCFITLTALLLACTACNASSRTSKQLYIKDSFNGISVANNIEVVYTPSSKVSISAAASDKAMSKLIVEVKNGILQFRAPDTHNEEIKITLTAPDLSSITALNNAEITVTKALTVSSAKITATNNGEIDFDGGVEANEFNVTATNNSEISMPWINVTTLVISTTNNAEFTCKKVKANEIKATATNNSEIEIDGNATRVTYTATNNAEIAAPSLRAGSGKAVASNLATIRANVDNLSTTTTNMAKIYNK